MGWPPTWRASAARRLTCPRRLALRAAVPRQPPTSTKTARSVTARVPTSRSAAAAERLPSCTRCSAGFPGSTTRCRPSRDRTNCERRWPTTWPRCRRGRTVRDDAGHPAHGTASAARTGVAAVGAARADVHAPPRADEPAARRVDHRGDCALPRSAGHARRRARRSDRESPAGRVRRHRLPGRRRAPVPAGALRPGVLLGRRAARRPLDPHRPADHRRVLRRVLAGDGGHGSRLTARGFCLRYAARRRARGRRRLHPGEHDGAAASPAGVRGDVLRRRQRAPPQSRRSDAGPALPARGVWRARGQRAGDCDRGDRTAPARARTGTVDDQARRPGGGVDDRGEHPARAVVAGGPAFRDRAAVHGARPGRHRLDDRRRAGGTGCHRPPGSRCQRRRDRARFSSAPRAAW